MGGFFGKYGARKAVTQQTHFSYSRLLIKQLDHTVVIQLGEKFIYFKGGRGCCRTRGPQNCLSKNRVFIHQEVHNAVGSYSSLVIRFGIFHSDIGECVFALIDFFLVGRKKIY